MFVVAGEGAECQSGEGVEVAVVEWGDRVETEIVDVAETVQ